jgi:hypothetical protein
VVAEQDANGLKVLLGAQLGVTLPKAATQFLRESLSRLKVLRPTRDRYMLGRVIIANKRQLKIIHPDLLPRDNEKVCPSYGASVTTVRSFMSPDVVL